MKDDIKNLIAAARGAYPNTHIVQRLCDELEKSAQFNEDTLDIKIKLQEGNKRLTEENQRLITEKDQLEAIVDGVLTAAGEDWQDVDDLPNVISKLRQDLELKSASGYPVSASVGMTGIPPMSPELFRQHAALAAMSGLLSDGAYLASELASDAVTYADALVQELAK